MTTDTRLKIGITAVLVSAGWLMCRSANLEVTESGDADLFDPDWRQSAGTQESRSLIPAQPLPQRNPTDEEHRLVRGHQAGWRGAAPRSESSISRPQARITFVEPSAMGSRDGAEASAVSTRPGVVPASYITAAASPRYRPEPSPVSFTGSIEDDGD